MIKTAIKETIDYQASSFSTGVPLKASEFPFLSLSLFLLLICLRLLQHRALGCCTSLPEMEVVYSGWFVFASQMSLLKGR